MSPVIFTVIVTLFLAGQSSGSTYIIQECSSWNYAYALCNVNVPSNTVIVHMSVIDKMSRSGCTYGNSYGFYKSSIWVNHGCRAKFAIKTCKNYKTLECDSNNYKFATCTVAPVGGTVNYVILKRQISHSSCKLYQSYGPSNDKIWVSSGCRGTFLACY